MSAAPENAVVPGFVLTWSDPAPPDESCRYDHVTAQTPFGQISIEWKSWKAPYASYDVFYSFDHERVDNGYTLDEAKRKAEAEFSRRIDLVTASAVKLTPAPGDVIAIWVDRDPSLELVDKIREALPDSVSVAVLRTGTRIELLDEAAMRAAGWVRA